MGDLERMEELQQRLNRRFARPHGVRRLRAVRELQRLEQAHQKRSEPRPSDEAVETENCEHKILTWYSGREYCLKCGADLGEYNLENENDP